MFHFKSYVSLAKPLSMSLHCFHLEFKVSFDTAPTVYASNGEESSSSLSFNFECSIIRLKGCDCGSLCRTLCSPLSMILQLAFIAVHEKSDEWKNLRSVKALISI